MDIVEQLRQKHKDMVSKLKWVVTEYNDLLIEHKQSLDENERLREDKAELLKALTNLYESCRWEKVCPTIDAAKDAIAKATEGEK
jgi:hypothetical protein